jgi:hypothetical protein
LRKSRLHSPRWKNTADTLSNLNFQSTVLEDNNEAELAFETHLNRMKKADIKFTNVEPNAVEIGVSKSRGRSKKWLISVWGDGCNPCRFFILKNMAGASEGKNKKHPTLSRVSTKPGSRTQIQLPDGSVCALIRAAV